MQKGECWTWNQRSWVQSSLGLTFCCLNFLCSFSQASDANIANLVQFVKKTLLHSTGPTKYCRSGMQAIQLNESVWHILRISGFTIEFIFSIVRANQTIEGKFQSRNNQLEKLIKNVIILNIFNISKYGQWKFHIWIYI